ncbi:MAG: hypothetical protein GKR89_29620 [Candidatus Latescibacteria bacterium]|nr:hypothetical protein [Candidatus Latescibacterota bacterium]
MLETLRYLLTHPYTVTAASLLIGFFILRDVVRVFFYLYDSIRRNRRPPKDNHE